MYNVFIEFRHVKGLHFNIEHRTGCAKVDLITLF